MLILLTDERAGKGWTYRVGGFRNRHTGYTVIRKIDWEDPDAEPEWWVQDLAGRTISTHMYADEAMDTAEATYELAQEGP